MVNRRLVPGLLLSAFIVCALLSARPGPVLAVCGDGVLDPGEECDDGNVGDFDFCSSSCRNELIPGSDSHGATDCMQEWMTFPLPAQSTDSAQLKVRCQDDDPSCDFGASSGDDACTFLVRMCFNVSDPRMATCTPSDIQRVRLTKSTRRKKIGDGFVVELLGMGAQVEHGSCTTATRRRGLPCTQDSDCDTVLSSGDGQCAVHSLTFDPPLDVPSFCTNFVEVVVPLRFNSVGRPLSGSAVLGLRSIHNVSPRRRISDRDALRLVCTP